MVLIVLVEKAEPTLSTSKKMVSPYSGPMIIKKVLPNDRYVICDMPHSRRTNKKSRYERIVCVDKLKPWLLTGGISDDTNSESGEDGVVLSSGRESASDTDNELTAGRGDIQDGRM